MADDLPRVYLGVLNAFLSYCDGIRYDSTHVHEEERLEQITPSDIVRYFNFKCYGVEDPNSEMVPTQCWSNSVLYWKKAISYYMPQKMEVWNSRLQVGNPTRSREVNGMIKRLKKFEVRRQGVPSSAPRALNSREFETII